MKVLLDTNIIIHREAGRVINQDIGILYKWLDRIGHTKCIHPHTLSEINKNDNKATVSTFNIKLSSYELLQTIAPLSTAVVELSKKYDRTLNDEIDTQLLNEVFSGRIDLMISEDKQIHFKASKLGISSQVYTINTFLEKITAEFPNLIDYKILSVRQRLFGEIDLSDPFFDSFKEDYPGFEKWFNKKSNEKAYVTVNNTNNKILSFLYLKREDHGEVYSDIVPLFKPKKRLKIGTFKVVGNGVRLGERFLKIIFDNALANKVEEIYVTIFDKRDEQRRLIDLLENWGFTYWGKKENGELVYVRDFSAAFNSDNPRYSYPFISKQRPAFMVSIRPEYHTELLPDSILRTESPMNFIDDQPHRNAINKVFISHSFERNINKGDIIVFYRMGETSPKYHTSVITTIGLAVESDTDISSEAEFISKCKNRSVFNEKQLKEQWNKYPTLKPFILSFLYVYSFPKRVNLKGLIDGRVLSSIENAPRGFTLLSQEQFQKIIQLTDTDESFIID